MRHSTTDGKYYVHADICAYCQLDTAGRHEQHCPITTATVLTTCTSNKDITWIDMDRHDYVQHPVTGGK